MKGRCRSGSWSRSAATVLCALVSVACAEPASPGDGLALALRGGGTVGGLASDQGTPSVVLIYDPSDCFTCFGVLPEWAAWGRENSQTFSMVFTREPTTEERRVLARFRVPVRHVLARRAGPVPPTPTELVLLGGNARYVGSVDIAAQRSLLLECMRRDVDERLPCVDRIAGQEERVPLPGAEGQESPWLRTAILCLVWNVEEIRRRVEAGERPLLVVDGVARERLAVDTRPECRPNDALDEASVSELSFRIPTSAVPLWGAEAADGAVVVRTYRDSRSAVAQERSLH